jgi:hypothetical protein
MTLLKLVAVWPVNMLVPAILAPVLGPNFPQVPAAGFIAAGIIDGARLILTSHEGRVDLFALGLTQIDPVTLITIRAGVVRLSGVCIQLFH